MKKQIISIIFAYAALLPAQNLVFNGSFELGTDGFAQKRVLRPDTNPKLEYSPLEITTDHVVDGKKALQMRNPFAEKIELIGKEFPVKKGHTYICRGSIRSSVPNTLLTVRVFSENFWEAFTKRINAGPEWNTFSYEFVPFNSDPHHLEIIYTDLKRIPAGTFWIDKLEIFEKGTKPETGPQIALRIGDPILEKDSKGTLELCAVSDRNFSGPVELLCKEDYDGTILLKKKFDLELKPGEIKKKEFMIPTGHNGGYTASVSGKDIRFQQADFIVCRKVPKHKIDPAKEFTFGINWGLAKEWHPGTAQKGYKVWTAPFARDIEMLSAIGCRILRDHDAGYDAASWALLEPEEGKWDTSFLKRDLEVFKKYNMELLVNLGRFNFFVPHSWQGVFWPLWLKSRCRVVSKKAPSAFSARKTWFPPEEKWREYVAKVVETAGKDVRYYELFNEANMGCWPKDYVRYSKIASKEIRLLNPDAKIIGLCVTSDGNSVLGTRFIRDCVKLGMMDLCDIASFHPYSMRELGSSYPADRYIAEFRQEIRKKIPIWNSELYYLFDASTFGMSQGHGKPHQLAARFLVDLGEGCQQSTAVHADLLWKQPLLPSMNHHGSAKTQLAPHANMAAANALVHFFEGAQPTGKIKSENGTVFYFFTKNGKRIGAMWNFRHYDGVEILYPRHWKLFDHYGNPIKADGKYMISDHPVFITNIGSEEETKQVRDIRMFPVKVGKNIQILPEEAYISLTSVYPSKVSYEAVLKGSFAEPVSIELPPMRTATIRLPYRNGTGNTLILRRDGSSKEYPLIPVKRSLFPGTADTKGEELSVHTIAEVSGEILKIKLQVTDPSPSPASKDGNTEKEDFAEILIDTAPCENPLIAPDRYNTQCAKFRFHPRQQEEEEKIAVFPANSRIDVLKKTLTPTPDGYVIELEIGLPKRSLEKGFAAFDWHIRNVMKNGTEDLYLSGDPENGMFRNHYPMIKFPPKEYRTIDLPILVTKENAGTAFAGNGHCIFDLKEKSTMLVKIPFDIKQFRGQDVFVKGIIFAKDVKRPRQHWNGIKLELRFKSKGRKFYPSFLKGRTSGSWDWRKIPGIVNIPSDADQGEFVFGLVDTSGRFETKDLVLSNDDSGM